MKIVIQNTAGEYEAYPQESPALPVFVQDVQYAPSHNLTHPKYPLWINEMSTSEQEKLKNADFFKQWLLTTTTLYPNLRKCYIPDFFSKLKNISLWDLKWRNDNFFLFHGDEEGRPIAEIKQQSLTPPVIENNIIICGKPHSQCIEYTTYSFGMG
ncbi:hypothetical protein [Escherichia sp. E2748]|nr:hypothetical protein [Escherichia sp. E2748]TGB97319.1 hypothetical protein CRI64_00020 [Escherichia sp. E2748]TLI78503.1 hypothetical protein FEK42_22420 [Escherichia sp. E2748]